MSDLSTQMQDLMEQAKRYFGQLNEAETYGWIAEGVGLLLIITGGLLFLF